MLGGLKYILGILLSVAFRLAFLFLIVCGLIHNTDVPSFSTATEISGNNLVFFGQLIATYLMSFLGVGFYLLCIFFICSFALSTEKKALFLVSIFIAVIFLSTFSTSDEWLFDSYGGVLGSLLATNFQDPYGFYLLIALILLITLRVFNLLTVKKIKKTLKKILRILLRIFSLPCLLVRKKLKSRSYTHKNSIQKKKVHTQQTKRSPNDDDSKIKCTYDLIKEDEAPIKEQNDTLTTKNHPKSLSAQKVTPPPFEIDSNTEVKRISQTEKEKTSDKIFDNNDEVGSKNANPLLSRKKSTHLEEIPIHTKKQNLKNRTSIIPSLDFLEQQKHELRQPENIQEDAEHLRKVLEDFKIESKIVDITVGPVVTLYELQPAAGIKSSSIIALSADVARTMSAVSARISIIPGRNVIGIELPKKHREVVFLREILESQEYQTHTHTLPITLGKTINGEPMVVDLARMPHLLIAGTTGSGKSVAVNAMILSLLYKLEPHECKLIMIDPKMLELSVYNDIPHLLSPVVTDPKKAVVALKWVIKEMERRYKLMTRLSVRNIEGYNKKVEEFTHQYKTFEYEETIGIEPTTGKKLTRMKSVELEKLPFIVVVVDEMADLMLVAGKEIETSIQRLAQMARASGIHMIMATQRPSVDVITGVIKANFPTRISFAVTSKIDSRTILGEQGAEQLLGRGDMLYMASGRPPIRIHGSYVSDAEVEKIVDYLKQAGQPQYDESIMEKDDSSDDSPVNTSSSEDFDSLYNEAIEIVRRDNKVSISYIQRRLSIGYNKAAKLVERMEEDNIVSPPNNTGKRTLL